MIIFFHRSDVCFSFMWKICLGCVKIKPLNVFFSCIHSAIQQYARNAGSNRCVAANARASSILNSFKQGAHIPNGICCILSCSWCWYVWNILKLGFCWFNTERQGFKQFRFSKPLNAIQLRFLIRRLSLPTNHSTRCSDNHFYCILWSERPPSGFFGRTLM